MLTSPARSRIAVLSILVASSLGCDATPPPTPLARPAPTYPPESIVPPDAVGGVTSGRTDANFEVTPDGAASYTIPLWVPAGRLGMQPDLALHYDNRQDDGIAGHGWEIKGTRSRIVRCARTIGFDGFADAIRFDDRDPYCLDGERLVLVAGTHAQPGAEYRTVRNRHARITIESKDALGPKAWRVYEKGGRIAHYAQSIDVTRTHVHPFGPQEWEIRVDRAPGRFGVSLSRLEDRAGNTIDFRYRVWAPPPAPPNGTQAEPQLALEEIVYTGSIDPNAPPPRRAVRFHYGYRSDPRTRWIGGAPMSQTIRLERIEMIAPDPVESRPLRQYHLAYRQSVRSERTLLASMTECDGATPSTCRAPITFDYESGSPEFEDIDTGISNIVVSARGTATPVGRIYPADFDRDGRDDIFYQLAGTGQYALRLATVDAQGRPGFGPELVVPLTRPARDDRPIMVDYDSDGHTDVLSYQDHNSIPGLDYLHHLVVWRTDPQSGAPTFPIEPFTDFRYIETADFDGDGIPDLLQLEAPTVSFPKPWAFRLRGPGVSNASQLVSIPMPNRAHRFLDVDGDGAVELLSPDEYPFLSAPPPPGLGPEQTWFTAKMLGRGPGGTIQPTPFATTLRSEELYTFLDLNGDGLQDAVRGGTNWAPDPFVVVNGGNGLFPPVHQPILIDFLRSARRVLDYDQDGRQDMLVRQPTSAYQQDATWVVLSRGDTLAAPVPLPHLSQWTRLDELEVFETLDVDGNGLDDFLMYTQGTVHLYVRKGKRADLLTGIVDAYGARIDVAWEASSNRAVYDPREQCSHPQRCHTGRMWLVSEHAEDDGVGGKRRFTYRYVDGRSDTRGFGFLGFAGFYRTDAVTGETVEQEFELDPQLGPHPYPTQGQPSWRATTVPMPDGGIHVTKTQISWELRTDASGRSVTAYPAFTFDEEGVRYLQAQPPRFEVTREFFTTQEIDEYGNVTYLEREGGNGHRDRRMTSYDHRPADWLVSLPDLVVEDSFTPSGASKQRRTAHEYEPRGFRTRTIVEPGAKGASGWEALPAPLPDGVTTLFVSYGINPDGTVGSVTRHDTQVPGPTMRQAVYGYDAEGIHVTSLVNAMGHQQQTVFHPGLGVPLLFEDEDGLTTHRIYDTFGRVRRETPPGGGGVDIHYIDPAAGAVAPLRVVREKSDGEKTILVHDALGRPTLERRWQRNDGRETRILTEYDAQGRTHRVSRPHFAGAIPVFTVHEHDPLGRVVVETRPDGATTRRGYRHRRTTTRDARNHETIVDTNEKGLTIQVFEPRDGYVEYEYGPFDTIDAVRDANGNTIAITHDRLGRVIAVDHPDAGRRETRYDAFGDLEREIAADGTVTIYARDALGRMVRSDGPDGSTHVAWDTQPWGVGEIAWAVSAHDVRTLYVYDPAGRLENESWDVGGRRYDLTYRRDGHGRVDRISYPFAAGSQRFAVRYVYGAHGQLVRAVDDATGQPFWIHVGSDASGAFGEERLGNGVTTARAEHPQRRGRLFSIESREAGGVPVQRITIDHDDAGNLSRRINQTAGIEEWFVHDEQNRLERWNWTGPAGPSATQFEYDRIGNLIARNVIVGQGVSSFFYPDPTGIQPHAPVSTSFGAYQWDVKGNLVSGPDRTIEYTSFDQPWRVTPVGGATTQFFYDAERRRVMAFLPTGEQEVWIDDLYQARVLGPRIDHVFYVTVAGRQVAAVRWAEDASAIFDRRALYLHRDDLGSIETITDEAGGVVERQFRDPYGERIDPFNPAPPPPALVAGIDLGWGGHVEDESGLIDMKARFYDPRLCRFVSVDHVLPAIGRSIGIHPYAYGYDNPVSWIDPTGLAPMEPWSDTDVDAAFIHDHLGLTIGSTRLRETGRYVSTVVAPAKPKPPKSAHLPYPRNDDARAGVETRTEYWQDLSIPQWIHNLYRDYRQSVKPSVVQADDLAGFARAAKGVFALGRFALRPTPSQVYFGARASKLGKSALGKPIGAERALGKAGAETVFNAKHDHHLIPQQLREEAARSGVDVDDYCVTIEDAVHQELHVNGWNSIWLTFFFENIGRLTKTEWEVMAYVMRELYGLGGVPVHRYLK